MPAFNTKLSRRGLPIVWQRSLLGLLFVALVIHFFWRDSASNHSGMVEINPPSLSADLQNFHYGELEIAFADLRFEQESLVIDASTESQFSIVLDQFPDGLKPAQLDRIRFLLEQQFNRDKSQKIVALMDKLSTYKQQEKIWWETKIQTGATQAGIEKHDQLFDLQDQLLGKDLAQALYSEQRRMTRYMAMTYAIENDDSLNEEQKQQALEEMAKTLDALHEQESQALQ